MNIERELKKVDAELSTEVARRAARRALPRILNEDGVSQAKKVAITTWLYASSSADPLVARTAAHSIDNNAASAIAAVAARAVYYAADSAVSVGAGRAAYSAARAAEAAAVAISTSPDSSPDNSVANQDVQAIQSGADIEQLRALPLWPDGEPQWYLDAQEEAERVMEEQRREAEAQEVSEFREPASVALHIEAPVDATPEQLQELALAAAKEMNRLHIENGGTGVHISLIEYPASALSPTEVP